MPRASIALLFATLVLSACDQASPQSGPSSPEGPTSPGGAPSGNALSLPSGLELVGSPHGYAYVGDRDCEDYGKVEIHGSGSIVTLCLPVRNTTASPIDLVLPPGLIFVSTSTDTQNGFLTETVRVTIPAGSVVGVVLSTYCMNESLHPPDASSQYTLGPVTDDPAYLELLALLQGIDLPGNEVGATDAQILAIDTVQAAVWEIAGTGTLTPETRADLEALAP